MKRLLVILLVLLNTNLFSQEEKGDEDVRYLKVDSSSPDAVIQDGTDIFESKPLGKLISNQKVTLLGEEDGEYVKIRAVVKGKTVEGWIKKIALTEKPLEHPPRISESGAVPSASLASPASVERLDFDGPNDPWKGLDLTGLDAKIVSEGVPLWIPIAGGAVLVGGAILLFSDGEDEPGSTTPPLPLDSCNASFSIGAVPAICKLPTGTAVLNHDPDIDISLIWDNGEETDSISSLSSGSIYAVVTYNNGACMDTIFAEIPDKEYDFMLSANHLKPTCTSIGDLEITHTPLPDLPTSLTIVGPSGTVTIPDPTASLLLSDYAEPITGSYTISISFDDTENCQQSTNAELSVIQLPAFLLADIFQPSGPDASDGAIFLETMVEVPPWTLYMNDAPIQTGDAPFVAIKGLGVGVYVLEIADGRGCLSTPQVVNLKAGGRPKSKDFGFQIILNPVKPLSPGN